MFDINCIKNNKVLKYVDKALQIRIVSTEIKYYYIFSQVKQNNSKLMSISNSLAFIFNLNLKKIKQRVFDFISFENILLKIFSKLKINSKTFCSYEIFRFFFF